MEELSSTLEDYLEAILLIEERKRFARVRDISRALTVAKSAVTAALRSLSQKQLVNYSPYEPVTLTPEGMQKARKIATCHRVVKDFLQDVLGLEAERAETMACEMEHGLDEEGLERLVCFLAFIKQYAPQGARWLDEFRRFIKEGADGQSCQECIERYLHTLRVEDAKEAPNI